MARSVALFLLFFSVFAHGEAPALETASLGGSVAPNVACRPSGGFELATREGLAKIGAALVLKNAREAFGGMALECDPEFELGWSGKRAEICRAERFKEAPIAAVYAEHYKKSIEKELGLNLLVDVRVFPRALDALEEATDDDGDARPRTLGGFVTELVNVVVADNCPSSQAAEEPLQLKLVPTAKKK